MFNLYDDHPEYVAPDRNLINVYNPGAQMIPAFTAIRISGTTILNTDTVSPVIFNAVAARREDVSWGIAAENIMPNSSGNMVVSGVAKAYISGSGSYANPGTNGKLVAGNSGKALILYLGTDNVPGIVQLGFSAGTQKEEYTGPFKLRHVEGRTFEICHGSYFDRPQHSDYQKAGNTDLPGATLVPRQNIILPENRTGADVYLHAIYEDGKYRVEFDFDSYRGFETIYIGVIRASGDVVQEYQEQGTIYFGRQWYL